MAKGFWKRTFGSLGKDDEEEYYEEIDDPEENYGYPEADGQAPAQELSYDEPSFARRRSKVISMPEGGRAAIPAAGPEYQMKMIIFQPSSYDETQSVIDSLRARKPVIINLDEIDVGVAQRILDFVSGAVYALSGDIKKAARNIFVVAPSNVEVTTNVSEDVPLYENDSEQ